MEHGCSFFVILTSRDLIVSRGKDLAEALEAWILYLVLMGRFEDIARWHVDIAGHNRMNSDCLAVPELSIGENLVIDEKSFLILCDLVVEEANRDDR